jgi:acyl carrier protein
MGQAERAEALLALVQDVVATVAGLAGATAVSADQPLKDLGLDSLMALEVRNHLSARTKITLPVTLVFDYPTPRAIAQVLQKKLASPTTPLRSETQRVTPHQASISALAEAALAETGLTQQYNQMEQAADHKKDAIDQMDHESILQTLDSLLK